MDVVARIEAHAQPAELMDINNGKIGIQHDGTDRPVAEDLMAAGAPIRPVEQGLSGPRRP
jgi:hypothetical protein